MISSVEPTNEEKLEKLKQEVGKAFFDYGRLKYEIETKEKQLGNISVNLHNLNQRCLDLQTAIDRDAKKAAMELKLAAPEANTAAPEATQ